jgi:hypothetical protein
MKGMGTFHLLPLNLSLNAQNLKSNHDAKPVKKAKQQSQQYLQVGSQ